MPEIINEHPPLDIYTIWAESAEEAAAAFMRRCGRPANRIWFSDRYYQAGLVEEKKDATNKNTLV